MSNRPKMGEIEAMLSKGVAFSLTEAQYEKKTGARMPKDGSYLLKRSALARKCKEYGFELRLQEKVVFMEKRNMT